MIWDEFLRHFRFCDEEDSGLSDEEQERKGPKNHPKHTRKRIHQAKKNFLEKFKTASYSLFGGIEDIHNRFSLPFYNFTFIRTFLSNPLGKGLDLHHTTWDQCRQVSPAWSAACSSMPTLPDT